MSDLQSRWPAFVRARERLLLSRRHIRNLAQDLNGPSKTKGCTMPDTNQHQDRQHQREPKSGSAWQTAPAGAQTPDAQRKAGIETMRQSSAAGVDARRQHADASSETMTRTREAMTEAVRRGAQAVAEGQLQFVQKAAEHFQEVSLKMAQAAQGTTEEWRRLMPPATIARDRLDDLRESAL